MKWGFWKPGGGENSSFWGLNQSGKDSIKAVETGAGWNFDQSKNYAARAGESRAQGNQRTGEAWDLYKQRANEGIGNTGQIRDYGQAAMPGVQEAIDARKRLLAQQQQTLSNFGYRAPQTMNEIYGYLDQEAGNVGQNWDFSQGIIDGGYAGMTNRANAANQEIVQSIKDTFGSARGQFNDAYRQLRGSAADVYGGLEGELEGTTAAQQRNVEMLKPGSDAFAARTARSYAPMMSNTMSRLRRGGLDPNSVQAGGMLSQAEAERARGIDDAAAQGTTQYVNAANNILGNRQAELERLRGTGLAMDTSLGTAQAGANLKLGLDEGSAFQDEVRRNLGLQTALDQTRQGQTLDNQQFNFQEGQRILGQKADAAQLGRQMGLQDLGLDQGMLDKAMQEEMVSPEALATQFGMGQNFAVQNANAQNTGLAGLSQIGQADLARSISEAMLAQGFSQSAIDAYLKNLGIQSANAGWGAKMLAGMAEQAARAYAGGGG